MKEFGLQLWSISNEFTTEENVKTAFLKMKEFGYTQAQTAGTYDFIDPKLFRKYADDAGIKIVGTHYSLDRMINDVEGTIEYHKILGTDEIGIGGKGVKNLGEMRDFIKQFNELAKVYHKHGFVLSFHNHSGEFSNQFKPYEGKTYFDYLIEGLDPETTRFNLDVAWAQLAGMDVRALIERLKGRINIIHLKDVEAVHAYKLADGNVMYGPQRIEIGRGNMNFPGIIKTAEECGVKYFIVEDEVYSSNCPLESVKMSADYIKAHLLEK